MNKNNLKNMTLLFGIFLAGMLSVSIANFFGGFYCTVAAIVIILATFYVFGVLDTRSIKSNKINLIMVGIIALLETIFFVVNDIFGYNVYVKGNVDFFGGLVIASQIYCILAILYHLIMIDISFLKNNSSIELVEEVNVSNGQNVTHDVEEATVEESNDDSVEEIRQIPRNEIKQETPFMEEEK